MPTLADTTIRLLGQEPLAGRMPTAEQLRLAEILDGAGFAYLEVSGGGCFASAVERGVESPWERIRALKARVKTPLGLALRGRFLVGSRPVDADFARRFVASAAENGIDVFRLHDPLNDISNLREAAEAIVAAERDFEAGLVYSPGRTGEIDTLIERARMLPELGAVRVLLHDPTGSLQPHRAAELVPALAEASGLPVGIYVQGAGGSALAATLAAAHAGAQLIACAVFPLALTLHRVSGEALAEALTGMGLDPGVDVAKLWDASDLVDEHIGDEPVAPLAPRIAVRAAQHDVPAGLVAGVDQTLRAQGAGDRLEEVLEELDVIRAEVGWPPLAAPIGQVLANQALLNVLSASRYLTIVDELRALVIGRFGTPPGPIDPAVQRAVELTHDPETQENVAPRLSEVRAQAEGIAASEEELLLLGLFGEDAERLLLGIRGRASGERDELASVDKARADRIRELVRIVQETGIGEVTIEEEGMRVSVRSSADAGPAAAAAASLGLPEPPPPAPVAAASNGVVRVESPMVGTFYRAAQPGSPPFVEEGDVVGAGQTLCILEAMKLMNEVKSDLEAVVRRIHVDNGQPVEFGQVLFDLEPLAGRPLDAV
ncbi:MAG TPA: acetyl-CoA carboxylase biotin carboxyl carrier protein [Gaiellaceae bacterium]|nr:acetyl-CoA carboxylase biotin carboxyl carrier protein [Gaiellaceae bacterium]